MGGLAWQPDRAAQGCCTTLVNQTHPSQRSEELTHCKDPIRPALPMGHYTVAQQAAHGICVRSILSTILRELLRHTHKAEYTDDDSAGFPTPNMTLDWDTRLSYSEAPSFPTPFTPGGNVLEFPLRSFSTMVLTTERLLLFTRADHIESSGARGPSKSPINIGSG